MHDAYSLRSENGHRCKINKGSNPGEISSPPETWLERMVAVYIWLKPFFIDSGIVQRKSDQKMWKFTSG